jgi:hypothetical protein
MFLPSDCCISVRGHYTLLMVSIMLTSLDYHYVAGTFLRVYTAHTGFVVNMHHPFLLTPKMLSYSIGKRRHNHCSGNNCDYLLTGQWQRRHIVTSSCLGVGFDRSTLSDQPKVVSDEIVHLSPMMGGTYIGLYAMFDAFNGQHIPIDERYIPSSLLEWGYPPSTLETLVSETITTNTVNAVTNVSTNSDDPTHHTAITSMTRSIAVILPATGCDNDNLEHLSSTEQWEDGYTLTGTRNHRHLSRMNIIDDGTSPLNQSTDIVSEPLLFPLMDFAAVIHVKNTNNCGIQTCFRWTPQDTTVTMKNKYPQSIIDKKSMLNDDIYRIRINVEVERISTRQTENDCLWNLLNPISVSLERLLSNSPNDTLIDEYMKGGGLDSRTVSQWLGPVLNSEAMRSFPKTTTSENFLTSGQTTNKDRQSTESSSTPNHMIQYVIPENVTIAAWQSDSNHYTIEIGHMTDRSRDSANDNKNDIVLPNEHLVISYTISMTTDALLTSNDMTNTNFPFSIKVSSRTEQL